MLLYWMISIQVPVQRFMQLVFFSWMNFICGPKYLTAINNSVFEKEYRRKGVYVACLESPQFHESQVKWISSLPPSGHLPDLLCLYNWVLEFTTGLKIQFQDILCHWRTWPVGIQTEVNSLAFIGTWYESYSVLSIVNIAEKKKMKPSHKRL